MKKKILCFALHLPVLGAFKPRETTAKRPELHKPVVVDAPTTYYPRPAEKPKDPLLPKPPVVVEQRELVSRPVSVPVQSASTVPLRPKELVLERGKNGLRDFVDSIEALGTQKQMGAAEGVGITKVVTLEDLARIKNEINRLEIEQSAESLQKQEQELVRLEDALNKKSVSDGSLLATYNVVQAVQKKKNLVLAAQFDLARERQKPLLERIQLVVQRTFIEPLANALGIKIPSTSAMRVAEKVGKAVDFFVSKVNKEGAPALAEAFGNDRGSRSDVVTALNEVAQNLNNVIKKEVDALQGQVDRLVKQVGDKSGTERAEGLIDRLRQYEKYLDVVLDPLDDVTRMISAVGIIRDVLKKESKKDFLEYYANKFDESIVKKVADARTDKEAYTNLAWSLGFNTVNDMLAASIQEIRVRAFNPIATDKDALRSLIKALENPLQNKALRAVLVSKNILSPEKPLIQGETLRDRASTMIAEILPEDRVKNMGSAEQMKTVNERKDLVAIESKADDVMDVVYKEKSRIKDQIKQLEDTYGLKADKLVFRESSSVLLDFSE